MSGVSATTLTTSGVRSGARAPWPSLIILLAAVSIVVGVLWDISWHRTIGRDTFWTPAHMAIYLGGLLGGLTGGGLILHATFWGSNALKNSCLRIWGFYGPTGAWAAVWGSLAMLTSAPFDDWWHNAYGLDVKILSPPHMVLAVGMWAIVLGALLMMLKRQNLAGGNGVREEGAAGNESQWLYLLACGILLAMGATVLIEESWPNQQHSLLFYQISATTYPAYLLGLARPSRHRRAATVIALIYMGIYGLFCWTLPLFPAEPKLGPIYNRVDHMVPLPFPLLLVVPALAIDWIRHRIGHDGGLLRDMGLAAAVAAAFLLTFGVSQWLFSDFLMSDGAANWFFAADRHWGYNESAGEWKRKFWRAIHWDRLSFEFYKGAAIAFLICLASSGVGLIAGNWMAGIKR